MTNHLMSFMVSTARLTAPTYEHGLSQRLIRLRSDSECIAPSMRNHAYKCSTAPSHKGRFDEHIECNGSGSAMGAKTATVVTTTTVLVISRLTRSMAVGRFGSLERTMPCMRAIRFLTISWTSLLLMLECDLRRSFIPCRNVGYIFSMDGRHLQDSTGSL